MGWIAPALSLVGGLLGASNDNSQRAKDRYLNSPAGIRAEAEAAGFNPLLFTGSAGSFGAGYAPQMGSKISSSFALAGDQMQREQELLLQQTRLEQENQRLAILAKQSQLNVADDGGIYSNAPLLAGQGSPRLRPSLANSPTVRVFLPDGQTRFIPQEVADRLKIEDGGYIMAGDYAELAGEFRGEVESALMADEIGNATNIPMFGTSDNSPDEISQSIFTQSKARGQEFSNDMMSLLDELRAWKFPSAPKWDTTPRRDFGLSN